MRQTEMEYVKGPDVRSKCPHGKIRAEECKSYVCACGHGCDEHMFYQGARTKREYMYCAERGCPCDYWFGFDQETGHG